MSVKLIVDSSADMIPQVARRVTVLPLTICFGDRQYVHGKDIDNTQFYEKLVESDVLPTTSQVTPFQFEQAFREATEEGYDVVCLPMSSKLSGTYQSAVIAAESFPGKVWVLDSKSVAIGSGILIEYALRLIDKGMSAPEIVADLEKMREKVRIVAMLDTLEYLKKGGRISKTVAFAGGLLSIKPVVGLLDGSVNLLGKARGSKQGNNLLVTQIRENGGIDYDLPALLGYTGLTDVLLKKYIEDSRQYWEGHMEYPNYALVGSVVGTHVGPGAVAVAFFSSK